MSLLFLRIYIPNAVIKLESLINHYILRLTKNRLRSNVCWSWSLFSVVYQGKYTWNYFSLHFSCPNQVALNFTRYRAFWPFFKLLFLFFEVFLPLVFIFSLLSTNLDVMRSHLTINYLLPTIIWISHNQSFSKW